MKNQGAAGFEYRNGIVNFKLLGGGDTHAEQDIPEFFSIYILNAYIHSSVLLFSIYLRLHLMKIGISLELIAHM